MPSSFSSAGTQRILQTSAPCSTQRFCCQFRAEGFRAWGLTSATSSKLKKIYQKKKGSATGVPLVS